MRSSSTSLLIGHGAPSRKKQSEAMKRHDIAKRKWLSRAKARGRRENLCRGNSATTLNGHDCDDSVHSRDIGTPCGGNPRGSISSASPALAVAGETSWCHLFRLMNVIALITTVDVGFSKHTVLSLVARARSIARQPGHFGSCRQSGPIDQLGAVVLPGRGDHFQTHSQ